MKIKIKKPKIKVSAPKVVTKAVESVTKPMSTLAKTATSGDMLKATLKGDLKGMGSAALKGVQGIKDAAKQFQTGQLSNLTGAVGTVGSALGSKDIKNIAKNVEREGTKGVNTYGDVAMDIGANVATGGTYGLAKTAAQGLASGGLKGLLSSKGLQDAALSAAGSYAGIDPNMIQAAQAGLKAAQGDIKGAALQGLGTFGGMKSEALKELGLESLSKLKPEELQKYTEMAKTGVSALTGDKAGIASGLASQFGAGEDTAKLLGAAAGGKDLKGAALQSLGSLGAFKPETLKEMGLESLSKLKPDELKKYTEMASTGVKALTGDKGALASGLASQLGAGKETAELAGTVAGSKDLKGEALSRLAGTTGVSKDILSQVSTGKFDVGELAKNANLTASLGDVAKAYMPGSVSSMIDTAKNAGRIVQSADAYVEDEANRLFDEQMGRAGLSREGVKQIEQRVKDIKGIPAALKETAQQQYQIAKGDTFNAIAKKMGVSPEELKRLNPQIKNINQIIAGQKLNLPGMGGVEDLSGPIEQGVIESGQMTQEQFDAEQAYQDWERSQEGYIGKEKKEAMRKLYQDRASGKISADDFAVGQTNIQEGNENQPGFLDKMKSFISGNKGALGMAAQVAGAGVGYLAGESARKEQEELAEKQLKEVQGLGGQFAGMQYDPTRYKQEREFLQQRVAGGGLTAEERKIQQEGDVRAARAAAAQRLAGMEQQARLGGSAIGTSALAAALSGAQAGQNIQAESNLSREASASQRLEQDIQRQTQLSRQQTAEEAELAKQQSEFGLQKAQQVGSEREELSRLAAARGQAAAKLAGQVTDTAVGAMERMESPEEAEQAAEQKRQAEQDRQYQEQQRQMQLEQQRLDLEAKRKAAQNLSMKGTPQQPKPAQPATTQPTQRPPAQPATGKPGEGYGVLQSSMGQADSAVQKASDMFNKLNQSIPKQAQPAAQQVQKGIQQAQNVVQQGQKVAQQVQQTADKAKKTFDQFKSNPFKSLFG